MPVLNEAGTLGPSESLALEPVGLLWSIMGGVGMAIAHGEAEPWVKGEWVATMEVFRAVFRQIPGGERRFGLPCHWVLNASLHKPLGRKGT